MDRFKDPASEGAQKAEPSGSVKRQYVAPVLVCLGTVAEMTQVNIDTATIPDRGSS
jgi:hypothetical protein